MVARTLLAAIVGGLLMFVAGAVNHMVFELESRNIRPVADEAKLHEFLVEQNYAPGMYGYPFMPENAKSLSAEEQTKLMNEIFARFKQGPAAYIVVAPTGQDAMGPTQLGGELVSDVAAAWFAALIVSCLAPSIGLFKRWLLIVGVAPCSWLSLTCSFALWYRFPWPFILDGLIAALIEWTIAGIAIVLIVGRNPPMRSQPSGQ